MYLKIATYLNNFYTLYLFHSNFEILYYLVIKHIIIYIYINYKVFCEPMCLWMQSGYLYLG